MPQSLSQIWLHIVFSTKDRQPFLVDRLGNPMHGYLANVVRGLKCDCYRVGGVADHVHLAVGLSRTITVADVVEAVKTSSSKKAKPYCANFSWQRGYGAFSAGFTDLPKLLAYIDSQAEHHKVVTFQDEYRQFLRENCVPFEEEYVWD